MSRILDFIDRLAQTGPVPDGGGEGRPSDRPTAAGRYTLAGVTVPTISIAGQDIPITEAWSMGRPFQRRVAALYRARLMTINGVKQLPVAAWKGIERLAKQPLIVTRPTPDRGYTRSRFVGDTVAQLLDRGTAIWLIRRLDDGQADTVRVSTQLGDERVDIMWDTSGKRRQYRQRDRILVYGRDVLDIALGRGPDELVGHGPMQSSRIAGIAAALNYSESYFAAAATPSGYLSTEYDLTDPEADLIAERWDSRHRGDRRTAVTGGGVTYQREDLASPNESEWVQTHMAGIVDIADLFGIPSAILNASMPGSSSALVYQNLADVYEAWWRQTLQPDFVSPIEEAWSLLTRRGTRVEFDPSVLIRGDRKRRYDSHSTALAAGFLTVDEVRATEGLPPLGDAAPADAAPLPETRTA